MSSVEASEEGSAAAESQAAASAAAPRQASMSDVQLGGTHGISGLGHTAQGAMAAMRHKADLMGLTGEEDEEQDDGYDPKQNAMEWYAGDAQKITTFGKGFRAGKNYHRCTSTSGKGSFVEYKFNNIWDAAEAAISVRYRSNSCDPKPKNDGQDHSYDGPVIWTDPVPLRILLNGTDVGSIGGKIQALSWEHVGPFPIVKGPNADNTLRFEAGEGKGGKFPDLYKISVCPPSFIGEFARWGANDPHFVVKPYTPTRRTVSIPAKNIKGYVDVDVRPIFTHIDNGHLVGVLEKRGDAIRERRQQLESMTERIGVPADHFGEEQKNRVLMTQKIGESLEFKTLEEGMRFALREPKAVGVTHFPPDGCCTVHESKANNRAFLSGHGPNLLSGYYVDGSGQMQSPDDYQCDIDGNAFNAKTKTQLSFVKCDGNGAFPDKCGSYYIKNGSFEFPALTLKETNDLDQKARDEVYGLDEYSESKLHEHAFIEYKFQNAANTTEAVLEMRYNCHQKGGATLRFSVNDLFVEDSELADSGAGPDAYANQLSSIKSIKVGPFAVRPGENVLRISKSHLINVHFYDFAVRVADPSDSVDIPTGEDDSGVASASGAAAIAGSGAAAAAPAVLGEPADEGNEEKVDEGGSAVDDDDNNNDDDDDDDDEVIGAAELEATEESEGWISWVKEEALASFYNLTSGEGGITLASEDATFPGMLLLLASLNINRTGLVLANIDVDFGEVYNTLFGWIADVSMLDVNLPDAPGVATAFTAIVTILFAPVVWKRLEVLRHEYVGFPGEGTVKDPVCCLHKYRCGGNDVPCRVADAPCTLADTVLSYFYGGISFAHRSLEPGFDLADQHPLVAMTTELVPAAARFPEHPPWQLHRRNTYIFFCSIFFCFVAAIMASSDPVGAAVIAGLACCVLFPSAWVLLFGLWRITQHRAVKIAFPPEERAKQYWDRVIEGEANALLFLLMSAFMTVVNYMFGITAEVLYGGEEDDDGDDGSDTPVPSPVPSPRPSARPSPCPTRAPSPWGYSYSSGCTYTYYSSVSVDDDDDDGGDNYDGAQWMWVAMAVASICLIAFILNINIKLQNVRSQIKLGKEVHGVDKAWFGQMSSFDDAHYFYRGVLLLESFFFAAIIVFDPNEVFAQMVWGLVISVIFFIYALITLPYNNAIEDRADLIGRGGNIVMLVSGMLAHQKVAFVADAMDAYLTVMGIAESIFFIAAINPLAMYRSARRAAKIAEAKVAVSTWSKNTIKAMSREDIAKVTFWQAVAMTDVQKSVLKEAHGTLLLSRGVLALRPGGKTNQQDNGNRAGTMGTIVPVGDDNAELGGEPNGGDEEAAVAAAAVNIDVLALKELGYSAATLRARGFTASDMRAAFSVAEGRAAGFTPRQLTAAGYRVDPALRSAKRWPKTVPDFIAAGVAPSQLLRLGFTAADFKRGGAPAEAAKAAGFTAAECRDGGYTALDLFDLCTPNHLRRTDKPSEASDVAGFEEGKPGFRVAVAHNEAVKVLDAIPNNGDAECIVGAFYGWSGMAVDVNPVVIGVTELQEQPPAKYQDVTEEIKKQVRAASGNLDDATIVASDEAMGTVLPLDATWVKMREEQQQQAASIWIKEHRLYESWKGLVIICARSPAEAAAAVARGKSRQAQEYTTWAHIRGMEVVVRHTPANKDFGAVSADYATVTGGTRRWVTVRVTGKDGNRTEAQDKLTLHQGALMSAQVPEGSSEFDRGFDVTDTIDTSFTEVRALGWNGEAKFIDHHLMDTITANFKSRSSKAERTFWGKICPILARLMVLGIIVGIIVIIVNADDFNTSTEAPTPAPTTPRSWYG